MNRRQAKKRLKRKYGLTVPRELAPREAEKARKFVIDMVNSIRQFEQDGGLTAKDGAEIGRHIYMGIKEGFEDE